MTKRKIESQAPGIRQTASFLANFRISTRITALALFGLVGLFALGTIYAISDSAVSEKTAEADQFVKLEILSGEVDAQALQMRRREKDFIMRGADKYVKRIDERRAEFGALLDATAIPFAEREEILSLLDKYVADFKAYAAGYQEERALRSQLSAVYAEAESHMDALFAFASEGYETSTASLAKFRVETKGWVIGLAAVIALILVVFSVWLVRSITGPVTSLTGAMQALAGGDKTIAVPGTGNKDEIGDMAKAVLVFKENMIRNDELQAEQEEERRVKEQRAEQIARLTDGFDAKAREVLQTVSAAATELQQTAESMSATAEETSPQAAAVSTASNQATANVQTVATAAEEMSASISEIGRQVGQSAKIAARAVDDAKKTNEAVRGLDLAAQKIGEVVTLINDIAGQTNLLALNATIEAARAGEAGKGFAVVAQEVKNLANQTAKATEEISQQIGAVQEETRGTVDAIDGIMSVITEISDIATTIASAVDQQGASTQEIARNVQEAARGTQEVSDNIGGVNQAASSTGAASNQVLESSQQLAAQAEGLRAEVESFLNDVRAA